MKLQIKNGFIYRLEPDLEPVIIGVVTDELTDYDERVIECGSEAVPAIEKFVEQINSGSFKPRTAVKEFERILEKYQ